MTMVEKVFNNTGWLLMNPGPFELSRVFKTGPTGRVLLWSPLTGKHQRIRKGGVVCKGWSRVRWPERQHLNDTYMPDSPRLPAAQEPTGESSVSSPGLNSADGPSLCRFLKNSETFALILSHFSLLNHRVSWHVAIFENKHKSSASDRKKNGFPPDKMHLNIVKH